MGFDDFFGFDEYAYSTKINNLDENSVRREHAIIRQKCMSAKAAVGAGAVGALHTAGFSLAFSGIGLRRNDYNCQKRDIIETRMQKKGWMPSELRKRDVFMAIGPSAAAACIAPGADAVTGHLAGHGAEAFISQHAAHTVNLAAHDPSTFVHAAEQGFNTQVTAVANGLTGNATQLVPVDAIATNTTDFFGNMTGQALAATAEMEGTKRIVKAGTSWGLGRRVNPPARTIPQPQYISSKPNLYMRTSSSSAKSQNLKTSYQRSARLSDSTGTINNGYSAPNSSVSSKVVLTRPSDDDLKFCVTCLLPALLCSLFGIQILALTSLISAIWLSFIAERTDVLKIWAVFTAVPAVGYLAGSQFLWVLAFSIQTWLAFQICQDYNNAAASRGTARGTVNSWSVLRSRRWPLILAMMSVALHQCSPRSVALAARGAFGTSLVIFCIQSLKMKASRDGANRTVALLLHVLDGCDCLAVGLVLAIYHATGDARVFLAGCTATASLVFWLRSQVDRRGRERLYLVLWETSMQWKWQGRACVMGLGVGILTFCFRSFGPSRGFLVLGCVFATSLLEYRDMALT